MPCPTDTVGLAPALSSPSECTPRDPVARALALGSGHLLLLNGTLADCPGTGWRTFATARGGAWNVTLLYANVGSAWGVTRVNVSAHPGLRLSLGVEAWAPQVVDVGPYKANLTARSLSFSPSLDLLLLLHINPRATRGSLSDLTVGLSSGLVVGGTAVEGCRPGPSPPPILPGCGALEDREGPFQLLCTLDLASTGDHSYVNSTVAAVGLFHDLPATRVLPPRALPPGPKGDGGRAVVTRTLIGLAAAVVLVAAALLVLQRKRGQARLRSRVFVT